MPSFIFLKKFQCFFRVFLKETYPSCQNKISPQSLCWGRNLRREFLEECIHNCTPCFRKNKYSEHKFFETRNKETFIQKVENTHLVNLIDVDPSLCCDFGWFESFLALKCLPKLIALHLACANIFYIHLVNHLLVHRSVLHK